MKIELIEKYIGDKRKKENKGPQAPKGYEWDEKKSCWRPKKKKVNEASPYGSTELWFGAWNRSTLIYVRNEEVLFSSNAEFPTGSPMTEKDRKRAQARGYILLDW